MIIVQRKINLFTYAFPHICADVLENCIFFLSLFSFFVFGFVFLGLFLLRIWINDVENVQKQWKNICTRAKQQTLAWFQNKKSIPLLLGVWTPYIVYRLKHFLCFVFVTESQTLYFIVISRLAFHPKSLTRLAGTRTIAYRSSNFIAFSSCVCQVTIIGRLLS